jgi:hypothetical protein
VKHEKMSGTSRRDRSVDAEGDDRMGDASSEEEEEEDDNKFDEEKARAAYNAVRQAKKGHEGVRFLCCSKRKYADL